MPQDKPEPAWQLTSTGTGGAGNPKPAPQAAAAPKPSDSTITAQSDTASDAAAVPSSANQPTHTLGTAPLESNTDRPESATDGAQVNAAPPKPAQPTACPPTGANTDCAVKPDMADGVASREELLAAFGTMCGHSNQQKLQGFLKAIAEYQEVSDCKSKAATQCRACSSCWQCPVQDHTLIMYSATCYCLSNSPLRLGPSPLLLPLAIKYTLPHRHPPSTAHMDMKTKVPCSIRVGRDGLQPCVACNVTNFLCSVCRG